MKQMILISPEIAKYIMNKNRTLYTFEVIPIIGSIWTIDSVERYPNVCNGKPVVELSRNKEWLRIPLDKIDFSYVFTVTDEEYNKKYLKEETKCDNYDYWTRLEHQYAGMFLQAQISYGEQENLNTEEMIEDAIIYAHALIEKLKEGK